MLSTGSCCGGMTIRLADDQTVCRQTGWPTNITDDASGIPWAAKIHSGSGVL